MAGKVDERRALRRAERWIDEVREVQAVAVGEKLTGGRRTGRRAIKVYVTRKKPLGECSVLLPQTVGGMETDVIETGGPFVALGYTERMRPVPCGCSIGHVAITAGTLGLVAYDRADGAPVIVTNNHVAADSNKGRAGDVVVQPGPHDGGRSGADTVGFLKSFVRIVMNQPLTSPFCRTIRRWARALRLQESNENLVDLALVRPMEGVDVERRILDIAGYPTAWRRAEEQVQVAKTGRTTGHREGECLDVGMTVDVSYGSAGRARFVDQDAYSAISAGGDSGSVIVSRDGKTVFSLLFAGSPNVTIGSPWQHVDKYVSLEAMG